MRMLVSLSLFNPQALSALVLLLLFLLLMRMRMGMGMGMLMLMLIFQPPSAVDVSISAVAVVGHSPH
jgi:hypothetical protein